jgi:hypothetical protein
MNTKNTLTLLTALFASAVATHAGLGTALIGWHKVEAATAGNTNSGATMNYATYNAVVAQNGSLLEGGDYLSGKLGAQAGNAMNGSSGFRGIGLTNSTTIGMNDDRFGGGSAGNGELQSSWGDAATGANAWKFGNANSVASGNQLKGDLRVVNNTSDKYFRLEFIHVDARGRGGEGSPNELKINYIGGNTAFPSNLISKNTGNEVANGKTIHTETWGEANTASVNVSRDLSISLAASTIGSQVYVAPGDAVSLRFVWGYNNLAQANGQSQLDNIALEGTFFDNSALTIESVIVPEPSTYALIFGSLVLAFAAIKRRKS